MQLLLVDYSILMVLIEVLLAFMFLVSLGLYRFSRGVMYRLWSIAWILFSVTTIIVIFSTSEGLSIVDAISTGGMMLSALLLIDGSNERRRRFGKEVFFYPIIFALGFSLVPIGIVLGLPYGVVFTPGGFLIAYACLSSIAILRKENTKRDFDYWTLTIGLFIWGTSMAFFPINIFVNALAIHFMITTTGLIMTGAGMLNVLIRETNEDLKAQNALTLLMSSIVNHDIRNYVATLSESINQMQISSTDQKFWLDLSTEAISSMEDFVEEIRNISAGISRFESKSVPLELYAVLNNVKIRVTREYDLANDAIQIVIDEELIIHSNSLINELFWNIIDNAFKHGSKQVQVGATITGNDMVHLTVSDNAGGLRNDVHDFLNEPDSLSSPSAPGMGLGVILIKGLSVLCGARLRVENTVVNGQPVGTVFLLEFKRHVSG
jgi:signal transduction histidine kinase